MLERDSVGHALLVATSVALACSLVVSAAVYWLRPIQVAYRSVEQNRAVLVAAGLAQPQDLLDDAAVVERFLALESRLVDLDSGRFVNADVSVVGAYDYRAAMDDPEQTRAIAPPHDIAQLGRRPLAMPVYLQYQNGRLDRAVLPVYGRGMWSTIHGYLVLRGDLRTIASAAFYEHGETPGIGDRIQNPEWLAQWAGKRAFRDDGTLVLRVGGAAGAPAEERIDAITGATVTVAGVDQLVRYWLGDDAYGPFLAALRREP